MNTTGSEVINLKKKNSENWMLLLVRLLISELFAIYLFFVKVFMFSLHIILLGKNLWSATSVKHHITYIHA